MEQQEQREQQQAQEGQPLPAVRPSAAFHRDNALKLVHKVFASPPQNAGVLESVLPSFSGYSLDRWDAEEQFQKQLLGGRSKDDGLGLSALSFAGPLALNQADEESHSMMGRLISQCLNSPIGSYTCACELGCQLGEEHAALQFVAHRAAAMERIAQRLDEYIEQLTALEAMLLPIIFLQVYLDHLAVHLAMQRIQQQFQELRHEGEGSEDAVELALELAAAAKAHVIDAASLFSKPFQGYRAADFLLGSEMELSALALDFLHKLKSPNDSDTLLNEYILLWTYEEMGTVCELADSCFTALTAFVHNAREPDLCGPYFNAFVLTCSKGYHPDKVVALAGYLTFGLRDVQDALSLSAMLEGLDSVAARWLASCVRRHFRIAELFDSQYTAKLCNNRTVEVLLADHIQQVSKLVKMKIKELEARVDSHQAQLAAMMDVFKEMLLDPKQGITREQKARWLTRLGVQPSHITVAPGGFGSRVASPEPDEVAAETSAGEPTAESSTEAEAEMAAAPPAEASVAAAAPASRAVRAPVAAPAVLRGGLSRPMLSAGRTAARPVGAAASGQPAGRAAAFGVGTNTANREAARRAKREAEEQAQRDRATYRNDSGLRSRRVGVGEGRAASAEVASGAYSRCLVQPMWRF